MKREKGLLKKMMLLGFMIGIFALSNMASVQVIAAPNQDGENTECPNGLTEEAYEEYINDGSWEERVEFMDELQAETVAPVSDNSISSIEKARRSTATMASIGEVKVLVFLVDFQDIKNTDETYTAESVKSTLFDDTDTSSLSGYYLESSKQKLHIYGDVYGWHTMNEEREAYSNDREGREKLLKELLEYYDEEIDYSQYDLDKDGKIDGIYINFAGDDTGWGSQWWSYKTQWYGSEPLKLDDVNVCGYVFQHRKIGDGGYKNTFIHETGHTLGLPDYYDYESHAGGWNGEGGGIGGYDMMDGSVGDHNAFSKLLLGWIDEDDIQIAQASTEQRKYALKEFCKTNQVILVTDKWENDFCSEYFLLEYYTQDGLNSNSMESPDGGIRVWHVNAWTDEFGNFLNDNSYSDYKLLKLMEADGRDTIKNTTGYSAQDTDLYKENGALSESTFPNSDYYNKQYTGINIKIGKLQENSYIIYVVKEEINKEVPEIVEISASSDHSDFLRRSIRENQNISISFSNDIQIMDESKFRFETVSGTECVTSTPVLYGNKLIFSLQGGDYTTQAQLTIDAGYFANTSGVCNS